MALPEPRPLRSLLQDGQLLPEGEVFGGKLHSVMEHAPDE
jgi:hypothetical protein